MNPTVLADPPMTVRQLAALLHGRRTVLPKRLGTPGPELLELKQILGAAAAAPDHGTLVPWRFVIVPPPQRGRLADVFAQSLPLRVEEDDGTAPSNLPPHRPHRAELPQWVPQAGLAAPGQGRAIRGRASGCRCSN